MGLCYIFPTFIKFKNMLPISFCNNVWQCYYYLTAVCRYITIYLTSFTLLNISGGTHNAGEQICIFIFATCLIVSLGKVFSTRPCWHLAWVILCCGDCPVLCRMFSSIAGLYPLGASSTPLTPCGWQLKQPQTLLCVPCGGKITPVEKHWFMANDQNGKCWAKRYMYFKFWYVGR